MAKKRKIQDLSSYSIQQLRGLVVKTQAELIKLETDLGGGKLKNVHRVKKKRRDLARVKTILREKELEIK